MFREFLWANFRGLHLLLGPHREIPARLPAHRGSTLAPEETGRSMKKCAYCGRDNPDDAEICRVCGERNFGDSPAVSEPGGSGFAQFGQLLFRVLVSILVWAAVSGLSLYVAWENGAAAPSAAYEQWRTQRDLRQLGQDLSEYRQRFHAAPGSLAQLLAMTNAVPSAEESPLSLDGWGRPFLFTSDGTNCLVTSLGRDGQRDGHGLDCDLTTQDPRPRGAFPTLRQFLFEMPKTRPMIRVCLLCGGLAFLLCLFRARMPELTGPGLVLAGLKLGAIIVAALLVTILISSLHIPSGH